MNENQLRQHVTVLGWLSLTTSVIMLGAGAFVFVLLFGIGVISGDGTAVSVLGFIGFTVGGLLFLLSIPGFLAGYGLLTRQPWGRVLALVVSVFFLFNFPIGTAIGAYAIWILLKPEASLFFEGAPVMR